MSNPSSPLISKDAQFVALLFAALIAIPNILTAFYTPGICATMDSLFQNQPLPHLTQILRSGRTFFVSFAALLPVISALFYFRSLFQFATTLIFLISLLLTLFIGLALYTPIIMISRAAAMH